MPPQVCVWGGRLPPLSLWWRRHWSVCLSFPLASPAEVAADRVLHHIASSRWRLHHHCGGLRRCQRPRHPGRYVAPPRPELQQHVRHRVRRPGDAGEAARVAELVGHHHAHAGRHGDGARRQPGPGAAAACRWCSGGTERGYRPLPLLLLPGASMEGWGHDLGRLGISSSNCTVLVLALCR